MNIRGYLNYHLRRATLCCWAASVAGLVAVLISDKYPNVFWIAFVACGLLFAAAHYFMFHPRCPRCRARLLYALATFGIHLRVSPWYTSCPSCGVPFDAPQNEPAKSPPV